MIVVNASCFPGKKRLDAARGAEVAHCFICETVSKYWNCNVFCVTESFWSIAAVRFNAKDALDTEANILILLRVHRVLRVNKLMLIDTVGFL